ncbi:IclR family transcriptional regulator [Microbulbifer thermotolerans]|uniref:IclR family transcriptional regulator n=1 Tax=Microbulbifer thermotolerans TaxID=252514 RepID=UPI0026741E53|nr:IclR family transcriptional regulator [Microbulbifer thermotolerans]WKT59375.1 IclR family transcriptional regulator [Microbulbifer thermotolerans]
MPSKIKKYAVPALDKALEILEFLAAESLPLSQSEIAQGIGRTSSEIYRVLVGLEARGYLLRDDVSGKYRMSLKLLELTRTLSPVSQLRFAAQPEMEFLAARLGQSCHLSVIHQGQLMVILQVQSPGPVSLSFNEGTLFPLLQTVSGRVLLANCASDRRARLLQVLPEPSQRAAQEEALLAVREAGYELCNSELTDGVTDCAALVGRPDGETIAALAVSSLTSVLGRQLGREELVCAVRDSAAKISTALGL